MLYSAADTAGKMGAFWTDVFLQQDFVSVASVSMNVCLQDLRRYVDAALASGSRTTMPPVLTDSLQVFVLQEGDMVAYADAYGGGLTYGDGGIYAGPADTWTFPFSGTVPEYLAVSLTPGKLLRHGEDYHVAGGRIILYTHPAFLDEVQSEVYSVSPSGIPLLRWTLYGLNTLEAVSLVRDLYAEIAGVYGNTSAGILQAATNIAWDLRVTGATDWNISRALYLSAGCRVPAHIPEGRTVCRISTEGAHTVIYTEDVICSAPSQYQVLVQEGELISESTRIFNAFRILEMPPSAADIPAFAVTGGLVAGIRGGVLLRNETLPVIRRRFPVGGSPADIDTFFQALETNGFYTYLIDRYGRVPDELNPVAELAELIRYSSLFIVLPAPKTTEGRSLLDVIRRVYPAGSTLFLHIQAPEVVDALTPAFEETAEVFQVIDAQDTMTQAVSDLSTLTST